MWCVFDMKHWNEPQTWHFHGGLYIFLKNHWFFFLFKCISFGWASYVKIVLLHGKQTAKSLLCNIQWILSSGKKKNGTYVVCLIRKFPAFLQRLMRRSLFLHFGASVEIHSLPHLISLKQRQKKRGKNYVFTWNIFPRLNSNLCPSQIWGITSQWCAKLLANYPANGDIQGFFMVSSQ